MSKLKNILVVRNDRFGEFLLNIPAFRALKETFGNASLTLAVNCSVKELAEKTGYVRELLVWENKKHSLKEILGFIKQLKRKKYDACVILNPSKEFNLISFLAGIPVRVGYDRKLGFLLTNKIKDTKHLGNRHEVDSNLELVGLIGANTSDKSVSIKLEEKAFPELAGQSSIAIHPFTSDAVKQWPMERFVELANMIMQEVDAKVVLVGKVENEIGKGIGRGIEKSLGIINLINKTSLVELAQVLKQCQLLVSCDSGPMHLAASVGTPVIALFRNDFPGKAAKRWGPWGEGHIVIEKSNLNDITVDEVLSKVKKILALRGVK